MTASRSSPQSALPLALRQTWPVILIVLLQATLAGGSIYVMSAGRLTAELTPDQFSQETILTYAMNEIEVA